MVKRPLVPFLVALVAAAALPVACASKPPSAAVTATADAGWGDPDGGPASDAAGGYVPPPAEAGVTPAPTGTLPPDASAPVVNPAGVIEAATDAAIDVALRAAAQKSAAQMAPEGQPGRATLAEGGHFDMLVTMQPGRCYTILGYSPMGQVTELELKLFAPPLYNLAAGQSSTGEKNQPALGKGKSALCPALPLPIAYKLDAFAKKGAGRIGVYVFARSR